MPIIGISIPKYQNHPVSRNGNFLRHRKTAAEMLSRSSNARIACPTFKVPSGYGYIPQWTRIAARIARISPKGQHEKHAAEHIFSLRYPGHRLHAQRMNCKDYRHQQAGPKITRKLPESKKQKDSRCGLQ